MCITGHVFSGGSRELPSVKINSQCEGGKTGGRESVPLANVYCTVK